MLSLIASRLERIATLVVVLIMLLGARPAHADAVDTLIRQLGDSSQRVRLAAALNLAKSGDERGILPLAKSLLNDKDKDVRAASAVGLGSLINANPNTKYKSLASANLKTAAANDASSSVQTQATNALKKIGAGTTTTPGPSTGGGAGVYVNVGPMSSKTSSPNNTKLRALMVKTTQKTLTKVAPSMSQSW